MTEPNSADLPTPPLFRCHIAGIPHRKPNLGALHVGDTVILEPEPTNKFDPEAVKVLTNEATPVHLGYIPHNFTANVAGRRFMTIVSITPEAKWSEVHIEEVR